MKISVAYFILFATIFLRTGTAKHCGITERYDVQVMNRLPNPQLRLHCASGNDELGYHNIVTNDNFHWSFCDSYTGKTLFFCHLWWGNQDISFDVFTSKFGEKCLRGKCLWEARPDGIYFSGGQQPSAFRKMHDWKK